MKSARYHGVKAEDLGKAVDLELSMYNEMINRQIETAGKISMRHLVNETKKTAPVGNRYKHYRDSISSKKISHSRLSSVTYVWYVKGSDYRLSHLLERGHANRDGGRTPGTHFIEKASDPILKDYVEQVEEILRNGGYS